MNKCELPKAASVVSWIGAVVFLEEQIGSRNSVGEATVHIERQAPNPSPPTLAKLAAALDLRSKRF